MNYSSRGAVSTEDLQILLSSNLPWERFNGSTVLITGAMGLIATYLVDVLLYRNEVLGFQACHVLGLVRDRKRAELHFAAHSARSDFELMEQDVAIPLPKGLSCDFIVHAAGNASPRKFLEDPIGTYKANVLGTHYLLEHAHTFGCEAFLLLSSGAVHGHVAGESTIISERVIGVVDPIDPYACYAESKRIAETMCVSWARQNGLKTRIARLGHTYGPGLRRDDDRAFANFVYSVLDKHDIVLQSDGTAVRPYCYLMDAADALFRILLTGSDGEPYLVVNNTETYSIKELANLLASLDATKRVRVIANCDPNYIGISNNDPIRKLDTSKLSQLDWLPVVDVKSGFERTLRSLS